MNRSDPRAAGADRRRAPRIEILASVELAQGDEVLMLTATNVSTGGVFLEADPAEHPSLTRGAEVALTLSLAAPVDEDDEAGAAEAPPPPQVVRARGKIVRVQAPASDRPGGYGLVLTQLGAHDLAVLRRLLAHAQRGGARP